MLTMQSYLLIPEQRLLLDITLIKLQEMVLAILRIDFLASWDENAWILKSKFSPTLMLVLNI